MNPEADAGAIRLVKGVFRLGDKSRSGDSLEIVDEAIQVDRSGKAIWRLSIPSERISSAASRAATQIGYFDVDGREFMLDVIKNNTGYHWHLDLENLYQSCDDAQDETCWQKIIYYGDSNLLTHWNKK